MYYGGSTSTGVLDVHSSSGDIIQCVGFISSTYRYVVYDATFSSVFARSRAAKAFHRYEVLLKGGYVWHLYSKHQFDDEDRFGFGQDY